MSSTERSWSRQSDRNAVYEKDGVGSVGIGCSVVLAFVGHLEDVTVGMIEVDELHVPLPVLLGIGTGVSRQALMIILVNP